MSGSMVTLRAIVSPRGLQTGPFGSQLKAEEYVECGVPVIMPKDIRGGKIVLDGIARVPEEKAKMLTKHRIMTGDILFPRRGDLGRIAAVVQENEGWLCGTGCLRVRLKENVNSRYIHQYVQLISVKHWLENNALGQTMFNLNTEIIGNLPIFIVSQEEQIAIASLLTTWDLAIEKNDRLIATKENGFTWLVKSLITDRRDTWEHLRADRIFKSIAGKCNGDVELLSVTQDRGVIPRTMLEGRVMSPESGTESYKLIKKGDFAISLRSFQGGIEYSRYHGLISPAYTVLRPKMTIENEFYRHFFKSYLFIEKYLRSAVIGIRDGKQISIPDFMTVKIPVPPVDQQKKIASILNTAQHEIDLLKKQGEAYRRQKRGLMQKLLTGEWRVKTHEEAGSG
ncbi:MAG: restriction endonuclease subunit S [Deltaproteobacteria bacterium]|nr:restriction endonuclease subunit S [Deltaproteobacteria bacterium]